MLRLKKTGCLACHDSRPAPARRNLFDMGHLLADQGGEALRSSRLWRARPLYSLAELKTINPLMGYLHDGRARTVEEAILWHAGEGEQAKQLFLKMGKVEREHLIGSITGKQKGDDHDTVATQELP
jgi:CxxC motif-containing protein (DUF1111 family)